MKNKKEVKPKYRPITALLTDQNLGWDTIDHFFVDFNQVHTRELIDLLRKLTVFTRWQDDVTVKPINKEREKYFERLEKILGIRFTEVKPSEARKIYFLANQTKIEEAIRKVLATREHIPNKIEAKKIRRLKAQGKYVID
jgi:hypothetical protein